MYHPFFRSIPPSTKKIITVIPLLVIRSVSDVLRAQSRLVKFVGGEAAGRTPYTFYKLTLGPKYIRDRPYNKFITLSTFIQSIIGISMDFRYRFLTLGTPWTQSMPSRDVNAVTRLAEASLRRDKKNTKSCENVVGMSISIMQFAPLSYVPFSWRHPRMTLLKYWSFIDTLHSWNLLTWVVLKI